MVVISACTRPAKPARRARTLSQTSSRAARFTSATD
nr:MAG TPA: hypothetical protein [Caudoviricetes sp.]